jgi:hypothetical protein
LVAALMFGAIMPHEDNSSKPPPYADLRNDFR